VWKTKNAGMGKSLRGPAGMGQLGLFYSIHVCCMSGLQRYTRFFEFEVRSGCGGRTVGAVDWRRPVIG